MIFVFLFLVYNVVLITAIQGPPWWSSRWDSALPVQGVQVRSLVGELGSHMSRGVAKKDLKKKTKSFI